MLGVDCSQVGHLVDPVHDRTNELERRIRSSKTTSIGFVRRLLSRAAIEHDLRGG